MEPVGSHTVSANKSKLWWERNPFVITMKYCLHLESKSKSKSSPGLQTRTHNLPGLQTRAHDLGENAVKALLKFQVTDMIPRFMTTVQEWRKYASAQANTEKKVTQGLHFKFHVQRIKRMEAYSNFNRMATMLCLADLAMDVNRHTKG